ncbi:response receiver-modulated diguanylate cyclase [Geotalea daltonii FRC-32]|uniref:diguanylate cyclase n=1 Tax=Geotalea daltonii (strain DSM 22248 / JCM 15807 / FRC-32) TaxID=316067 RepID=B9M0W8_GEODF|nr:diguanylate cyclase [Geotalea daltonii]ACM20971.1 response receiver-modulated diguanylate cyclase [Geotalea daltonii FRC-32]
MERILVVEDDSFFREVFADLLRDDGFAVDVACSGEKALEMLRSSEYALVVTDLVMPDITGLDLLSKVKQFDPSIDVILVTGHANTETAVFALKNGARDYLVKPINSEEFKHAVALCFEQRRLLDENQELKGLLNLFQISQTIANSLDFDRIHTILVDSLAKEFGLSRLTGYFQNDDGTLELKEIKGFDEETASSLGELIFDIFDVREEDNRSFVLLNDLEQRSRFFAEHSVTEAMLFFVRAKTALLGIIIVFNESQSVFPAHLDFKNINFLLDQASLALENASRYNNAKNLLYIDELTGLFNYRYLDVALEREVRRAERYSSNISIIFLDIDLFKRINDQYGHLVGSKALAEVGLLLKKSVRDVDTVIRYGGDEYTIILIETGIDGASVVAERIRSTIEGHVFIQSEGLDIKLTASLGCASYPEDACTKLELLELADQAMYRSKACGKNMVFHISAYKKQ